VHRVDEAEARAIEPRAKTVGHALFVPSTATGPIDCRPTGGLHCARRHAAVWPSIQRA
jgi:hypothetical protein